MCCAQTGGEQGREVVVAVPDCMRAVGRQHFWKAMSRWGRGGGGEGCRDGGALIVGVRKS